MMRLSPFFKRMKFCVAISDDFRTAILLILKTLQFSIYCRRRNWEQRIGQEQKSQIYRIKVKNTALNLQLRLQDIPIFYEIFHQKTYQLPPHWITKKENLTIVDLGAHVGLTTLFLWLHYFPNGQFICVEASSKNLPLLKFNLKNTPCTILEGAIFHHEKGISFTENTLSYNHKINISETKNLTPTFSMQGIMERFNLEKIHLAKIDIEGAEQYILKKNTAWLAKTNNFIIELHDNYQVKNLMQDTQPFGFQMLLPEQHDDIHMICGEKLAGVPNL